MEHAHGIDTLELLAPDNVTSSADGSAVDLQNYTNIGHHNMLFFITCGAVSGTSPTLDVKIQESADGSTGWTDVTSGAFTQLTAAGNEMIRCKPTKRYIRESATLAGTSPDFTFAVVGVAEKRLI